MRIQYPRIQLTETEYASLLITIPPNCEQKPIDRFGKIMRIQFVGTLSLSDPK